MESLVDDLPRAADHRSLWARLRTLLSGDTPVPQQHTIAYSGAFLFGSGATLVAVSLAVEHNPSTHLSLALASLVVAYSVTAALIVFPNLVPVSMFPYLTALGTVLITVIAYADGSVGNAFSLLYVWVALYSFYFYGLRTALLETVLVSAAAAAGPFFRTGTAAPFSLWLLTTGTSVVGGLAIRQLVMQVRRLANRDELTGLYTRRRLQEELVRDLRRAERSGETLSLLMIDLDNFKEFNDYGGHLEGDRHLREAARRWTEELRAADLLARFGGEEFIVLMPSCSLEEAVLVADRLRGLTPNGQTASAGAVSWDGSEDALGLIARADSALYRAKVEGRDRTVVHGQPCAGVAVDAAVDLVPS